MVRSVRIQAFGEADVLRIEEVETPVPGSGEVRLRIHAIGINRTEITLRSGRSPAKPALPSVIGFEAAGLIEAIGPDVTGFAPGERVALVPTYSAAQYAIYGEAAVVPARALVSIPEGVGYADAAATWVAFGTAWGGLVHVGALQRGRTVLVSAASSGVGLAAIQIANRLGARVIATTRSNEKVDALRAAGAAAVVVTSDANIVEKVRGLTDGKGADLVFDPVGGPGFADLAEATAAGGMLILYGALDDKPTVVPPFAVFGRDLRIRGLALTTLTRDDAALAALKRFVREGLVDGGLHPTISRTFAFDDISDSHRFMEAGGHVGKIVVTA